MVKKIIFPICFTSFLALAVFVFAQPPVFPMAFYGTIKINDANAPAGTIVRAYNSAGQRIDQGEITTTTAGLYGTDDISNPNPAENRLLVVGSGTIYFRAIISGYNSGNEIIALQTETFSADTVKQKDLVFSASATPSPTCSIASVSHGTVGPYPGCAITCDAGYTLSGNTCIVAGSGGGGGGGGGGSPAPTSTTTKGDINEDKKVDKYDLALMMAAWGKTGSNSSDLNEDGKVDKYDFALLMANWGKYI